MNFETLIHELPLGLLDTVTVHVKTLTGDLFTIEIVPYATMKHLARTLSRSYPKEFPCMNCIRLSRMVEHTLLTDGEILMLLIHCCDPVGEWLERNQEEYDIQEHNGVSYVNAIPTDYYLYQAEHGRYIYDSRSFDAITEEHWDELYALVNNAVADTIFPVGHYIMIHDGLLSPYEQYKGGPDSEWRILLRSLGEGRWAPWVGEFEPTWNGDRFPDCPEAFVIASWM